MFYGLFRFRSNIGSFYLSKQIQFPRKKTYIIGSNSPKTMRMMRPRKISFIETVMIILIFCSMNVQEIFSFQLHHRHQEFGRNAKKASFVSMPSLESKIRIGRNNRRNFRLCSSLPSSSPQEGQRKDGNFPTGKREIARTRLRQITSQILTLKSTFVKSICNILPDLSKIAKSTKVLISCFLFVLAVKFIDISGPMATMNKGNGPDTTSDQNPPIEIPYSKFIDYCEGKNGRQQAMLAAPPLFSFRASTMTHIDNVQVDETGKQIGFRLLKADTPKEKRALKDYMKTNDEIHLEKLSTKSQQAYTRIVNTINPDVVNVMRQNDIEFQQEKTTIKKTGDNGGDIELVPTVLIGGVAYSIYKRNPSSSSNKKFGAGTLVNTSKKKDGQSSTSSLASFDDIEGIDDAKTDVMELVDTLRYPEKYSLVGARPPTGLLLEGPPGTGKTTLAKACAAMADVPFISCSGSSFVERYVGTGAARVRKLFDQAAKINGPCIIFIDEIDALGKARKDGGSGGSNSGNSDESEQTLNQLLACMDGLDDSSNSRICVLGATNRKDVLDPALIRPGRFDRIVKVGLPSSEGRERILRVHTNKLSGFTEGCGIDPSRENSMGIGKAVDLSAVAAATDGLSGAELELIVNEAAIFAVRRVSSQLKKKNNKRGDDDNIDDHSTIDNTVYPEDFEESVKNFFNSRGDKNPGNKKKQFGFVVNGDNNYENSSYSNSPTVGGQRQIFKKKSKNTFSQNTMRPVQDPI